MGITSSSAVYTEAFTAMQGLVAAQGRGNSVVIAVDFLAAQSKVSSSAYYAIGTAFVAKVAVADAFTATNANETSVSALVSATAGTGTGMTTATTDVLSSSSSNNIFSAIAATTGNTYDTGDMIVDSTATDKDVLNLTASIDVTAVPTITNIETINVNVDAITTTDTDFAFAATSIGSKTTFNFDNVAAVTAINSLTVTALNASETVNVSNDFSIVSLAAGTNSIITNLAAAGTVGTPTELTIASAAKNVTETGAGHLSVTAATATGAITATAAKNLKIDATAAAAVIATSTGGNVTLTDVDSASLVNVTATGSISSAATALKDVKTLNLNAGGVVTATLATGATLTSATIAGKGTTNSLTDTDGTLVELSLSGNGGAATFALGNTDKLNTVNISGSQNVTVTVDGASLDGLTTTTGYDGVANALAINDTSTGVSTVKIGTAAGNANLSKSVGLDAVELAFAMGTKTLTLPAAVPLLISATQGAAATTLTVAQPTASKATNTLAITLNNGTKDGTVADFVAGTLALTAVATATIDASIDTAANGTSAKHAILGLTGTNNNTSVTINGGVNALDLAAVATGAISIGTGKLTVNGTGAVAVTHAAGTLSAAEFDASGKTAGVVTAVGLVLGSTPIFKTGAGADVITLITAAGAAASTIDTGSGNDTVTLFGDDYGDANRVFAFGEGDTDTLTVPATAVLAANTGKSITISGLEVLDLTGDSTIAASVLTGQTWTVQQTGDATAAIAVEVGSGTTINLSTLVETLVVGNTVAATVWTTDASAKLAGYTITGMSAAENVISGAVDFANTLFGGSKVDVLNAGSATDTLTGGAGSDTFDLTASEGGDATNFVTITDFAANATALGGGDNIAVAGNANIYTGAVGTWILLNGMVSKVGGTVASFLTSAPEWVAAAEANAPAAGALMAVGFVSGGSTYIYYAGADAADSADDVVVKLTGVTTTVLEIAATTSGAVIIA